MKRNFLYTKQRWLNMFPSCCLEESTWKAFCIRVVSVPKRFWGVNGYRYRNLIVS